MTTRPDSPPPATGGEWPDDAAVERAITGFYRDDEKWKRGSPTSLQRLRDDMRNALIAAAPPSAQASSPKPKGEAQGGAAPCYLCTEKHLRGWRVIAGFERREDAEAFHDSLAIVRPSLQALEDILSSPTPPEITDEVVARFHVIFWDTYHSGKNASTAMRRVLTEFQKSGS